jgi:hypothetical protein
MVNRLIRKAESQVDASVLMIIMQLQHVFI